MLLLGRVGVCCLLCVCRVLVVVVGSELEVDVLALADALEVGLLVVGDVVVSDVQASQCPDGGMDGAGVIANVYLV